MTLMERLREMLFGRRKGDTEPVTADKLPEGESRVDEIAAAKSASDRALARAEVLSPADARLRAAVSGTARGFRAPRRTGG